MKIDIKALVVTLVIMGLIVGFIGFQASRVERVETLIQVTPWCGSYTPQMSPDLFQVVDISWIERVGE